MRADRQTNTLIAILVAALPGRGVYNKARVGDDAC